MGKFSHMRITVIGESNIDIAVKQHGDSLQGGCTPAEISFHHGGVARNIAHNLSLLGLNVSLVTVFGGDGFASQMMKECQHLGIDLSLSTRFQNEKSPVFLSFNDKTGNMLSAVSDITLNRRMDLEWLKDKMNEINRSDLVVADTLLTAEALCHLIDFCEVPLYIDTVSPKRALVLAEALDGSRKKSFHALKCNESEAQSMTGEKNVTDSAKILNDNGIKEVFVTSGENGVLYSTEGNSEWFASLPAHVVDVVGAGDAFLSGIVYANALGINGLPSVTLGLKAAKSALESPEPCNGAIADYFKE